jgi:mRNA-degrading endonuclease RelE of RelBE toxin-antitoxin system
LHPGHADAANLDIKALTGAKPWLRLRVGDYRILYWQRPEDVYEVGRIVHRRDLDASAASLPAVDARD